MYFSPQSFLSFYLSVIAVITESSKLQLQKASSMFICKGVFITGTRRGSLVAHNL